LLSRLFVGGALSNIANPKIATFYFAFLPSFVTPGTAHPMLAVFILGLVFAALTFFVKGPVGLAAGPLSGWLRARPHFVARHDRTKPWCSSGSASGWHSGGESKSTLPLSFSSTAQQDSRAPACRGNNSCDASSD
jgi:hypothetical protein